MKKYILTWSPESLEIRFDRVYGENWSQAFPEALKIINQAKISKKRLDVLSYDEFSLLFPKKDTKRHYMTNRSEAQAICDWQDGYEQGKNGFSHAPNFYCREK